MFLVPRSLLRVSGGRKNFEMKLFARNLDFITKFKQQRKCSTAPNYIYTSRSDEYTSKPNYPPINLISPQSEAHEEKAWYDKIKRQKTVEEKLFEVNVQRRWGWKCFIVREGIIPYNNLVFAQHITRTHLIENEKLPSHYNNLLEKSKILTNEVIGDVIDAIEYQLDVLRYKLSEITSSFDRDKQMTKYIILELNRILMNSLGVKESHLRFLQVDYSPRIEASWKIGSLVETYVKKFYEEGIPLEEIPEEYIERPSDKYIQYLGNPILQLRGTHPLPQLIPMSEAHICEYSVPKYDYDPHYVLGYEIDRRHLNNIPGFWPGDDREFSFMSYHFSNDIKDRYDVEDTKEAFYSRAIFASFGWLMPLACYQGFSSYHDNTYPMVTQTILTNGREFTFATYQLNTTEMHQKNFLENFKSNICWITPSKPLYEVIENGKLKGFNEEVLQMLIQFYLNTPRAFENVQLKPYLGDEMKHVADYSDDEKVEWLHEKFRDCCSNKDKSRARSVYEVQDWERIYKIYYKLRQQDARRRPFELRENPYQSKMSFKKYVPKHLRPDRHLPKYKQRKFRRTFFPE